MNSDPTARIPNGWKPGHNHWALFSLPYSQHGFWKEKRPWLKFRCLLVLLLLLLLLHTDAFNAHVWRCFQPNQTEINSLFLSSLSPPGTGKVLGHGAFGKVMEASMCGIGKGSGLDTVAVKMLKGERSSGVRSPETDAARRLSLGARVFQTAPRPASTRPWCPSWRSWSTSVTTWTWWTWWGPAPSQMVGEGERRWVPAAGVCCTSTINAASAPPGPLMVVVEYCKYGNLSNFLRAKREFFLPYRVSKARLTRPLPLSEPFFSASLFSHDSKCSRSAWWHRPPLLKC